MEVQVPHSPNPGCLWDTAVPNNAAHSLALLLALSCGFVGAPTVEEETWRPPGLPLLPSWVLI